MSGDKTGKHLRRQREFRFRRSEILDAAEKLFSARGFHGTTMAEIAASSGFSIGGLYQFFSGKEQLYSTMVEEKVRRMYDGIMDAVDREESVEDKIRALVIAHFAYVEHHVDFYRLLIGHESGLRSEGLRTLRERILEEHRGHVARIEGILREGIRRRVLRRLDTKSLANGLIGIIAYFKFAWIMNPEGTSLTARVDDVLELFFRGASPAPVIGPGMGRIAGGKLVQQEAE